MVAQWDSQCNVKKITAYFVVHSSVRSKVNGLTSNWINSSKTELPSIRFLFTHEYLITCAIVQIIRECIWVISWIRINSVICRLNVIILMNLWLWEVIDSSHLFHFVERGGSSRAKESSSTTDQLFVICCSFYQESVLVFPYLLCPFYLLDFSDCLSPAPQDRMMMPFWSNCVTVGTYTYTVFLVNFALLYRLYHTYPLTWYADVAHNGRSLTVSTLKVSVC